MNRTLRLVFYPDSVTLDRNSFIDSVQIGVNTQWWVVGTPVRMLKRCSYEPEGHES